MTKEATNASALPQMTGPYSPPPLTLRVCFSGHRARKLDKSEADQDLLQQKISEALLIITEAFDGARKSLGEEAKFVDLAEAPKLRFGTSLASGGDMMALNAAVKQGYDLHLFLPMPEAAFLSEQEFTSEQTQSFDAVWSATVASPLEFRSATRTVIDLGTNAEGLSPYASCGRLMLDHADVLIALWDGETDGGPGGTRDVMRDAQRRGQTVLMVSLDGEICLWVPDAHAADPATDGEWLAHEVTIKGEQGSASERLEAALRNLILPPGLPKEEDQADKRIAEGPSETRHNHNHPSEGPLGVPWRILDGLSEGVTNLIYGSASGEPDAVEGLAVFKAEKAKPHTWWFGFYALQMLFAVRKLGAPRLKLSSEYDRAWDKFSEDSKTIGGKVFGQWIDRTIFPLWAQADQQANYYSHVFRTAYILSFILSVLAVACGLAIVFEADKYAVYETKGILVLVELVILTGILLLVYFGTQKRWQKRWIAYRSLAEILRPMRMPLLVGSVPTRSGEPQGNGERSAWIAWYVRSHLRSIPPPNGKLDPEGHLKTAIKYAIDHELEGQIAYHRSNSDRLGTLDHRMHLLANILLVVTILGGGFYIVFLWLNMETVYEPLKPWVTFLGGILPVCGAAINGIRATGDFRSSADQSRRTVVALSDIQDRLKSERDRLDGPRRYHVRLLMNEAVRIMADDLNIWSMIYSQRELGPGVG